MVDGSSSIHLAVIVHGLWGSITHVQSVANELKRRAKGEAFDASLNDPTAEDYRWEKPLARSAKHPDCELEVLLARTNESSLTYDGVDICGDRVAAEIDETIERLKGEGKSVVRFSIIGYSLGGLIGRYVSGVLFARGFFDSVTPASFMTIASPAIGIPGAASAFSSFIAFAGSRLLSRSGAQLYARDKFAHDKPLIEILAEPGTPFYDSLLVYERVDIYCNTVCDRTVPYSTGAFSARDPFAAATRRAKKARALRGAPADPLDPRDPLDLREGGLFVVRDEHFTPVLVSFSEAQPEVFENKVALTWSERLPRPPAPFRPSTWLFAPGRAGKYFMAGFWWAIVPPVMVGVAITFAVQARTSSKRIALADSSGGSDRLGRLGLAIRERRNDLIETAAEVLSPGAPSEADHGGDEREPDDAVFTPAQARAAKHLHGLYLARKGRGKSPSELHLVYTPEARHSHATIIARSPAQFPLHGQIGRPVLRHWLVDFEL